MITVIALAKHFPSLMLGGAKEWWVILEAAPQGERQFVLFLSLYGDALCAAEQPEVVNLQAYLPTPGSRWTVHRALQYLCHQSATHKHYLDIKISLG